MQVHTFEVVARRTFDDEFFIGFWTTFFRHFDTAFAREKMSCRRIGMRFDFRRCAARNDLPTVLARARPHIDHIIGGAYHVFVVLNHNHRIVQIAQMFQGFNQTVVVALMQANRRLIEHIHHARQTRADLRSQTNALRLAA